MQVQRLPRYVVFGEALTDMIRQDDGTWRSLPGGSCWNVARVGARLGLHTGYAGAVSMDAFGDEIAAASGAAGLDARFLQRVDAPPFIAMVTSRHPPVTSSSARTARTCTSGPSCCRPAGSTPPT